MSETAIIQQQTFSGHESFPIRFTWLTKAVRRCEPEKERNLFARNDAMVQLGVGKNMVRSIRFWAVNTGMLVADEADGRTARFKPSELGSMIFGSDGHDPFMEDPGTVWLLHWQLASNRQLGTWFWIFNELRESEFERTTIARELAKAIERRGQKPMSEETIVRDIDCLIRTYVPSDPDKRLSHEELLDCPLTELGLLRRSSDRNTFAFHRGSRPSLPAAVFAYALAKFWEMVAPNSNSLRFDQVAFSPGSPGQVFKLSENAMIDRLHELDATTRGMLRFDETSGLRQLLRTDKFNAFSLLRKNYDSRTAEKYHAVC